VSGTDGSWRLRVGEVTGELIAADAERAQERGGCPEITPLQRDLSASGPRFGFFFSKKF